MVRRSVARDCMTSSGDIHVAGTGSFALEITEYARAAGIQVVGLIELQDPGRVGTVIHGLPVHAADHTPDGDALAVVGVGGDRLAHWERLAPYGWRPGTIVHPGAHVSTSAQLGRGCVVAPRAVIGAVSELGEHVLVGRGALVGHHTVLEAGVTLNPGANVAGHVRVGRGAAIGMGSLVANTRQVGAGAIVAAGAAVVRDVEPGTRVQGVPARRYEGAGE
jgi:sugar O-acyltransferase (sialic acid O-acetyltransferase NeuD family)